MLSRIMVIILGIPIVYYSLTRGDLPRFILFGLVTVIAQAELFRLMAPDSSPPLLENIAGLLILFGAVRAGEHGLLLSFALAVTALAALIVLRGLDGKGSRRFTIGTACLVYIPFSLAFFLLIAKIHGGLVLFALLLTVWALDIGAYAVGMTLRGPALAPRISPNKTIAGALGGFAATFIAVWALAHLGTLDFSTKRLLALAFTVGVLGQIADLFESVIKREAQQKDSGFILGAHGGMLDRLDSMLLLGPVVYLLLTL